MIKVLLAASECSPLIKIGGIADVVGSLPKSLSLKGVDVKVVIPYYKDILDQPELSPEKLRLVHSDYVMFDNKNLKYSIYALEFKGLSIYLVLNHDFISNGGVYYDKIFLSIPNLEATRFGIFSKIISQYFCSGTSEFYPDIIHCNDWHTGGVVQFLEAIKRLNPNFIKPKTIFTIHNLAYQGFVPSDVARKIGLDKRSDKTLYWDLLDDNLDLLLQGIIGSDFVTTVSQTYAKEIKTKEYGEGLDDILNSRGDRVLGILNGIDYEIFNPESDNNLSIKYTQNGYVEGKKLNKLELISELSLLNDVKRPIISIVSRLANQKGFDLLVPILPNIIKNGATLVILGTGDPKIQDVLNKYNDMYSTEGTYKAIFEFSNKIAMKLYAASDFFLVPSRFEPCGLTQLISKRYGTIPIVRKTGGLADTVVDGLDGYVFTDYKESKLLQKINQAIKTYNEDKNKHNNMIIKGFTEEYSWAASSDKYINLYNAALNL